MTNQKKKKRVVDPTFASRTPDYAKVISAIEAKGKCPFCRKNFKYHTKKFLRERGGWIITPNAWPYQNTARHFLIINPRKHQEGLPHLTAKDWVSILFLAKWAVKKYRLRGGALCLRFGQTACTGATVCHLHAHLIVPKLVSKTGRVLTVNFPVG